MWIIVKYIDTWDLESIFPGGTNSKELKEKLQLVEEEIGEYDVLLNEWDSTKDQSAETLKTILNKQEVIGKGLGQSGTFVQMWQDRKSTRLNSSHVAISYAVFCL